MKARFLMNKIYRILPHSHSIGKGIELECLFALLEIHVFNLGLGVIFEKLFNSL